MIVYVELNFVFELAFQCEEHDMCEAILGFAERETISKFQRLQRLPDPRY